jgi:hypothetical protein
MTTFIAGLDVVNRFLTHSLSAYLQDAKEERVNSALSLRGAKNFLTLASRNTNVYFTFGTFVPVEPTEPVGLIAYVEWQKERWKTQTRGSPTLIRPTVSVMTCVDEDA